MTSELSAVSRTAIATAAVRAHESDRPDALFDDPYAAAFVSALAGVSREPSTDGAAQHDRRRALAFHVMIRTRFYDEWINAAAAAGIDQVVLVGAGLDTRAYRLAGLTGCTVVEVDLPAVLDAKQGVLDSVGARPLGRRVALGADVRSAWTDELTAHGLATDRPTTWLAEGLFAYLDDAESAGLLTAITEASAPGSRLALERGDGAARAAAQPAAGSVETLWRGGLGGRLAEWLTEHGWHTTGHDLATVAAGYGRPMGRQSRSGFLTAVRD